VDQGLLQRRTSLAEARPVYALKRFSSSKLKTNNPLPNKRTVLLMPLSLVANDKVVMTAKRNGTI
jgi:hypothetical protein